MWYEALPPFIIMAGCITITGYGLKFIDRLFLEGKPRRYSLDDFDRRMIERDQEITGSKNRQKEVYVWLSGFIMLFVRRVFVVNHIIKRFNIQHKPKNQFWLPVVWGHIALFHEAL